MNLQPIPTSHAIGELFGFPIRKALFFAPVACPITDIGSILPDDLLSTPQGHVSNTFSLRLSFTTASIPLVSPTLHGPMGSEVVVDRITNYLTKAALRARSIEEKECYELASAVVLRAYRADSTADVWALCFAWKYGNTPEKAAEKTAYFRAWMLHSSTNKCALPLPPKKPAASVSPSALAAGTKKVNR